MHAEDMPICADSTPNAVEQPSIQPEVLTTARKFLVFLVACSLLMNRPRHSPKWVKTSYTESQMSAELGAECILCREEREKAKPENARLKIDLKKFLPMVGQQWPNMLMAAPHDWNA